MENEYNRQLELFSQAKDESAPNGGAHRPFLTYISKYEKSLLIIIGFVIIGIASFTLGVEKGKRLTMVRMGSRLDIAVKPTPALPVSTPKQQVNKEAQYQPVKEQSLTEYMQGYTIQVASFTKRVNAQKEADILKNKGLSASVLSKGKFSIVCVGKFSKQEEAQTLLTKLKKQYQDCRIRRL